MSPLDVLIDHLKRTPKSHKKNQSFTFKITYSINLNISEKIRVIKIK